MDPRPHLRLHLRGILILIQKAPNDGKGRRGVKTIGDGVVGLSNIGNTCYINSVLQCLSHTAVLTEYFLSQKYANDVNMGNPFGFQASGETIRGG